MRPEAAAQRGRAHVARRRRILRRLAESGRLDAPGAWRAALAWANPASPGPVMTATDDDVTTEHRCDEWHRRMVDAMRRGAEAHAEAMLTSRERAGEARAATLGLIEPASVDDSPPPRLQLDLVNTAPAHAGPAASRVAA